MERTLQQTSDSGCSCGAERGALTTHLGEQPALLQRRLEEEKLIPRACERQKDNARDQSLHKPAHFCGWVETAVESEAMLKSWTLQLDVPLPFLATGTVL